MNKMEVLCCGKCFESIAKQDARAARLWLNICGIFSRERTVFAIKDFDSPSLAFLEHEGYILTTEDESFIAIKVKGYMQDEFNEEVFCIFPKEHSND